MFYRIALSDASPYNVVFSENGTWFYIPGELQPFHIDELSEVIELPVPHVTYQDGTYAKIGDTASSIDGELRGVVTELYHPKGIFTSGRVKLDTGKLVSAGAMNRE